MVQPKHRQECAQAHVQERARSNVFAEAARKAATLTLASTLGAFCASSAAVASTAEQRGETFSGQALESPNAECSADERAAKAASNGTESASSAAVDEVDGAENPNGSGDRAPENADAWNDGPSSASSPVPSGDNASSEWDGGPSPVPPGPGVADDAAARPSSNDADASDADNDANGEYDLQALSAAYDANAISDQASLAAAVADGADAVTLAASFSIDAPISLPAGASFSLSLGGNTLTCAGSAFAVGGEATIVVLGPGALNAGGALVAGCGYDYVSFVQTGASLSAASAFDSSNDFSYDLMGGTLTLGRTLELGANSSLAVGRGSTFSSSAGAGAVSITSGTATMRLDGTLSASGPGVAMASGTRISISNNATLSAGGNAISAGNACEVSIGSGVSLSAGGKVLATSGDGSGTQVSSGAGVMLSDGTIAKYLAKGVVVEFESGVFSTVKCADPEAQDWYGSIDDIWCPTQYDYDELLKLLPNGRENCKRYNVSFVGEDGTTLGSVSVRKGHCVGDSVTPGAPTAPEVAGKEFECWKDESGGKCDAASLAKLPVTCDVSYVAHYEDSLVGPVDPGPDVPDPGPGPDEPDPPTPPDPGPDEPGPVGPVGPVDPGAGGSGAGGNGGSGSGTPTPPNPSGSVGPGAGGSGAGGSGGYGAVASAPGSRGPLDPHAPETPWNPPGLALAAGFTVPASGPGVLVRELMSAPGGTPAAGAGSGDGGGAGGRDGASPWDALGAGARTFFDAQGPAGVDLPLSAAEVAVLVGLGAATALAALIASRRAAFLAANAASTAASA